MSESALSGWHTQFEWEPLVENASALRTHSRYLVCGMGGSHLGAWLLKAYAGAPIDIHRDYGLPATHDDMMLILSSYSGNTEEVLDAGRVAIERGIPVAAITTGGTLLEFAREHGIPHVIMPADMHVEPRFAIPLSMLGIAKLMDDDALVARIREAGMLVAPEHERAAGEKLADFLKDRVPVIYSSAQHEALAYIWKISLNETSKTPAFANHIPEACHNELESYDGAPKHPLTARFAVLFIGSTDDHPRNLERMKTMSEVLMEKGVPCEGLWLKDSSLANVFAAVLQADWATLSLAHRYQVPDTATALIAEFKRRIGQ